MSLMGWMLNFLQNALRDRGGGCRQCVTKRYVEIQGCNDRIQRYLVLIVDVYV